MGKTLEEAWRLHKKRQKMGTEHTKFEKLMMSHVRANLCFLIYGKVLVTRAFTVPVEYVESLFFSVNYIFST